MIDFKLPELGENVTSGDVTRVLVNVGDTIAPDQPVLELETDKATVEVPSTVSGVVREIKVKTGDTIKVGSVVLAVEEGTAQTRGAEEVPHGAERETGEPRGRAEARSEAPSRKIVTMPRPGRAAPEPAASGPEPAASSSAPAEQPRRPAAPASPSVRRLAREIGVDVGDVHGTGAEGRISEADVKEHARRILTSVGTGRGTSREGTRALPDFTKWGEVERQAMSGIRRKTAENVAYAWSAIPHVTQCEKADVTLLEELRRRHASRVEERGGRLTMTAILVKMLAAAVKQFPQFNASLDIEAEEIIYKRYVNVGVAVDTDRGLLVPVIRDVDRKNLTQIAVEVHQVAARARDRKLTLDDMSGSGMTISNLGGIGGTYFTPIVNWPEVAILGVSRSVRESVLQSDGSSGARVMLPLSLSYDHRAIDGADAMRFLRWIADALEQPFLLSLVG